MRRRIHGVFLRCRACSFLVTVALYDPVALALEYLIVQRMRCRLPLLKPRITLRYYKNVVVVEISVQPLTFTSR